MPSRYININYPFKNSDEGFFLDLTSDDREAIRADLMHLILTRRGQRLYNPDFGTNLLRFIFEPNDAPTLSEINNEISTVVAKFLPNLKIDKLSVTPSDDSEYASVVRLDYTITSNVFEVKDFVIINI